MRPVESGSQELEVRGPEITGSLQGLNTISLLVPEWSMARINLKIQAVLDPKDPNLMHFSGVDGSGDLDSYYVGVYDLVAGTGVLNFCGCLSDDLVVNTSWVQEVDTAVVSDFTSFFEIGMDDSEIECLRDTHSSQDGKYGLASSNPAINIFASTLWTKSEGNWSGITLNNDDIGAEGLKKAEKVGDVIVLLQAIVPEHIQSRYFTGENWESIVFKAASLLEESIDTDEYGIVSFRTYLAAILINNVARDLMGKFKSMDSGGNGLNFGDLDAALNLIQFVHSQLGVPVKVDEVDNLPLVELNHLSETEA